MSAVHGDVARRGERTWLLLQRDLSVWLRDIEVPTLMTIVLDLTDNRTRAAEAGATIEESFKQSLRIAASEPRSGLPPAVPDRIQVANGMARAMESVLSTLSDSGFRRDTLVEEVVPEDGAEWVFDDLITHIAGRHPPEERLRQEDATLLYAHAREFLEAAPWQRWTSDDALLVELKIGSQRMEGIATIMGHGPTQPGLLLTPGREPVHALMEADAAPPQGTLMAQFEGTEGHPDLFLRARRYGWPAEAAVTPSFTSIREHGLQELDRRESWPMALALAGVVKHFEGGGGADTWGNVDLPSGRRGRYHVRKAPEIEPARKGGELLGIKVSRDLLSDGSDVQIGLMDPQGLDMLRKEADVVVRAPIAFPTGMKALPVITMTPSNRAYASVVDRLKRARPIGATVINGPEGPMLIVIGERAGFVLMLLSDPVSALVWPNNIKQSDGAHVLIVSDGVINVEEPHPRRPGFGRLGHVYALFECVLRGGGLNARDGVNT